MEVTEKGAKVLLIIRGCSRHGSILLSHRAQSRWELGGQGCQGTPPAPAACCSPVGGLGPIALDVVLQGDGESFLQLVHHATLHHTWPVWWEEGGRVVPARP